MSISGDIKKIFKDHQDLQGRNKMIDATGINSTAGVDCGSYITTGCTSTKIGKEPEMKTTLELVKEFHEAFGHPVKVQPNIINEQLNKLRVDLIAEELKELQEALAAKDEVETLDALLDLQYVLDGAFLSLGFYRHKQLGFIEVHNSNMSKLGEDGKPIYREDGKIMKSTKYKAPNLEQFINMYKVNDEK